MQQLAAAIGEVRARIARAAQKSGRDPAAITLVAVSKTADIATVGEALALGLTDFGENRVQQLRERISALPEARWHMIGRLQTNKVKEIVGKVVLVHSLDRWNLAEALDKRGQALGVAVPALVQVNIAGEEQKTGVSPEELPEFLDSCGQLSALRIMGFMTMAPLADNQEEARPVFRELYHLQERLGQRSFTNVDFRYLSMGMSQDYEVAIEEGANIVRVGSAIFNLEQ